jgi:hypothetical protein
MKPVCRLVPCGELALWTSAAMAFMPPAEGPKSTGLNQRLGSIRWGPDDHKVITPLLQPNVADAFLSNLGVKELATLTRNPR